MTETEEKGVREEPPFKSESSLDGIRAFFGRARLILFEPAAFFRALPLQGTFSRPLAFAVIIHWASSALQFLWMTLLPLDLGRADASSFGLNQPSSPTLQWFFGVGSVILSPFITVMTLFISSAMNYVAALIVIRNARVKFESMLRIQSYAAASGLIAAFPVPYLAPLVGWVWGVVVQIIGIREVFQTSTERAVFTQFFFTLVGFALSLVGVLLLGILIFAFKS